jgi:hypothetical protein
MRGKWRSGLVAAAVVVAAIAIIPITGELAFQAGHWVGRN